MINTKKTKLHKALETTIPQNYVSNTQYPDLVIETLSGACGSGKTELIIRESVDLAINGKSVIIALPAISTATEVYQRLTQYLNLNFPILTLELNIDLVHSELSNKPIRVQIESIHKRLEKKESKSGNPVGSILILTHESLLRNNKLLAERSYTLFQDELPSCIFCSTMSYKSHPELYQAFLDFYQLKKEAKEIQPGSKSVLIDPEFLKERFPFIKTKVENKNKDTIDDQLKSYYLRIDRAIDKVELMFLDLESVDKFIIGCLKTFEIVSCLNPELFYSFRQTLVASASISNSLFQTLYKSYFGVTFIARNDFEAELRKTVNKVLTIHYLLEKGKQSKYLNEKQVLVESEDNQTILECFNEKVIEDINTLPNKEVLVLNNKGNFQLVGPESVQCDFAMEGSNKFKHITNFVYSAAFNITPAQYRAVENIFGVSELLYKTLNCEKLLQGLMRTSLRDPDNIDPVNLYVPCLEVVLPILEQLGFTTELTCLDDNVNNIFKNRKRANGIKEYERQVELMRENTKINRILRKQKEELLKLNDPELRQPVVFSQCLAPQKILSNGEEKFIWDSKCTSTKMEFIELYQLLSDLSKQNIPYKEAANLFNGVKFKDNIRSKENALFVTALIFDYDTLSGRFVINENILAKLLGVNTTHITHNTFEKEFGRRVIVQLKEPITIPEYELIMEELHRLSNKLYPDLKLDPCCLNVAQPYYLPSRTKFGDNNVTLNLGVAFDGKEFVKGYLKKKELTEQFLENNKNKEIKKSTNLSSKEKYEKIIKPKLDDLHKGNRFHPGQRLVGLVKRYCPEYKDELFGEFKSRGMEKNQIKSMERLWNKPFQRQCTG